MNKNEQITKALYAQIAAGKDAREAIETVFGKGAYENVAGQLYEALRAKAASDAGAAAAEKGERRVPALCPVFRGLVEGVAVGDAIALSHAWLNAWDEAYASAAARELENDL